MFDEVDLAQADLTSNQYQTIASYGGKQLAEPKGNTFRLVEHTMPVAGLDSRPMKGV